MEELKLFILQFVQPNEDELMSFLQLIKTDACAKGKRIIKAGIINDKIFFVKKGILKYCMLKEDGKEKAMHIAMENDLVADFFSFYSNYPSLSSVETLTECELLFIEKKDLTFLYDTYKIWERFGRLVAESAVLEQIMEKLNFQTKSPEQRYTELITKKPSILQEVNLGVIAESLGITQETLSRIRARI
jgi:CRP/FNR family transcriptional regulator, anaerobic regulatory protein